MKYTNDEINRFLERRLNPNLYSDAERSVDQASLELENLLPHPLLNDVMVALYHIKMKLIVYFTKHTLYVKIIYSTIQLQMNQQKMILY